MGTPMNAAARKRAERERKRERGLIQLEVWVRKENQLTLRRMEKKLQEQLDPVKPKRLSVLHIPDISDEGS